MIEPVVIAPKFWSFSLHIFSQASQNVTVKVEVDQDKFFSTFSVILLMLGCPESLSSSTDTRPALNHECR
jgi:hypothetical protein